MTDRESSFVNYLEGLVSQGNRQALAELRRGLSGDPSRALGMYRYVGRFLTEGETGWNEQRILLVASLFALYHQGAEPVSKESPHGFGASFRQLFDQTERKPSTEQRFVALVACHPDNLPDHLRHAVTLLRSERVGVDWVQLLSDLRYWSHSGQKVQRRWARQFFRSERLDQTEPHVDPDSEKISIESEQ
jgi:CRISPR system Cascade subunit CasB